MEDLREIGDRARDSGTEVVINFSGGDLFQELVGAYGEDRQIRAVAGSNLQSPSERHAPIGELLPEICTLAGSLNFGDMVYMNSADGAYQTDTHRQSRPAESPPDARSDVKLDRLSS
ncbi:3-keto-5-aminohexanoate cleavage protein [Salinisphaera sp. Q1T1-3]|uniref:3-keto-5-aminohexanoate cleavage protein n=1 Tax=Salinisphaera sp. Q1T1-3 TaxID=2321229 RepID=UPI000E74A5D3|nr:3-keto-5-aminohexanoate cleavage protein [Salinisphaera sp. Q1T1-3]RJS94886.1 hypothetical protein D3260_03770 [Salinisphaera sp. Q1T1-3]